MKKMTLAVLVVIAMASSAFAADNDRYGYDKYNHNGSYQDRWTPPAQKAQERETLKTQTNINKALDTLNKRDTTSAPRNSGTSVYDAGRGSAISK